MLGQYCLPLGKSTAHHHSPNEVQLGSHQAILCPLESSFGPFASVRSAPLSLSLSPLLEGAEWLGCRSHRSAFSVLLLLSRSLSNCCVYLTGRPHPFFSHLPGLSIRRLRLSLFAPSFLCFLRSGRSFFPAISGAELVAGRASRFSVKPCPPGSPFYSVHLHDFCYIEGQFPMPILPTVTILPFFRGGKLPSDFRDASFLVLLNTLTFHCFFAFSVWSPRFF